MIILITVGECIALIEAEQMEPGLKLSTLYLLDIDHVAVSTFAQADLSNSGAGAISALPHMLINMISTEDGN